MSDKPPPKRESRRPPAPKTHASGEHPITVAYRKKLESIGEGTVNRAVALENDMDQFLESMRPAPPEVCGYHCDECGFDFMAPCPEIDAPSQDVSCPTCRRPDSVSKIPGPKTIDDTVERR